MIDKTAEELRRALDDSVREEQENDEERLRILDEIERRHGPEERKRWSR